MKIGDCMPMKSDSTGLLETKVYKKFYYWIGEDERAKNELHNLEVEIKIAEGNYKKELLKKLLKRDFLKTFVLICKLSYEYIHKKGEPDATIKNIIGSTFGRLIFETETISSVNKIIKNFNTNKDLHDDFWKWIDDRRDGYIWIKQTKIDQVLDGILSSIEQIENTELNLSSDEKPEFSQIDLCSNSPRKKMSFFDYAKYEFALISGSSYTDVESMIARGVSRTSLCNILYGFIMTRLLIDSLDDRLYLSWYEDNDLFKGRSGISYFFDAIIILDEERDASDPWLLKCVATSHNPLDALEDVSSELEDIEMKKCILFLPTYRSEKAMRYFVFTYAERHQEIIILYLHDLYELLRIDPKDVKSYLNSRRIRS